MTRPLAALVCILFMSFALIPFPAFSFDLTDTLSETREGFQKDLNHRQRVQNETARRQKEEADRRWRNRDKFQDACYKFEVGSDIHTACMGEFPATIRNERARNIMQGYCGALGSDSFSSDLSYVCSRGVSGCSILRNGDAAYACQQCGGTRRWLAVYSLGGLIKCYK